jgi:hypothetical protein
VSLQITLAKIKSRRSGLNSGFGHTRWAQRSYPDLAVGFLLCFFLLSNVIIILSLKTKKPAVRGRFAWLTKHKNPDYRSVVVFFAFLVIARLNIILSSNQHVHHIKK